MSNFKVVPITRQQCEQCGEWQKPLIEGVDGVEGSLMCWECASSFMQNELLKCEEAQAKGGAVSG